MISNKLWHEDERLFFFRLLILSSIIAFSCLFLCSYGQAADNSGVIRLSSHEKELFLGPYLHYLEDKEGTFDIEDVSDPANSAAFNRCKSLYPGFGFTSSVYWFKFTIKNPYNTKATRFLEVEYPLLDYIDLYVPDGKGKYTVYHQGDRYNFSKRPIPYRNFVFIIKIPGKSTVNYFLKVKTSSSLNIPARLYTQAAFMDKIENEETALGIYFGILFAMLAYNLILYFTIRESVYLYYVLFVIFNFLFQLDLTGVAFKYLWPYSIWWANESLPLFILVAYLFGTLFTRQIINTRRVAPNVDKVLAALMWLSLICAVLCLFFPYKVSIKAATLISMTVVVHIFAGFLCLYRGYRPARYYALAWSISMAAAAIYAFKSFGFLPNNFLTVWGIQIGSAWEVILLSMALSDRLSLLQKEKEQIRAEYTRKLEDFAKGLEEKVRQRTIELEKSNELLKEQAEEMRIAEERAEKASKAKSDFLANMSHEIRTPLNAITGITALALEMELPDKLRQYLNIVKVSANALLSLVNDILDLSKIEAGKMELESTDFDLIDVTENIADMFTEIASEKAIEFVIDVDHKVPNLLQGDPVRLGQLLTNLVSNAMKFTEQGQVFLGCTVCDETPDKVTLSFKVSDTGIGIEKERLDYLFDMFTQADSSTTRRFGGTGLGLTICKKIAELMDGNIQVESKPGSGTTFVFTATFPKAGSQTVSGHCPLKSAGSKEIVIVTSNLLVKRSLENILKRLGIKTFKAVAMNKTEQGHGKPKDEEPSGGENHIFILDISEKGQTKAIAPFCCTKDHVLVLSPFHIAQALSFKNLDKKHETIIKPATLKRVSAGLDRLFSISSGHDLNGSGKTITFSELRILVVEDNEINQMVAKEILEKLGAKVDFASNGREALGMAQKDHDIIFMDIQMPEMDGYQATMALRRNKDFAEKPIIAMTAGVFKEDKERCFQAGMNDFVMKPVTPESVLSVLKKWVSEEKIGYREKEEIEVEREIETGFPVIPGADYHEAKERFGSNSTLYLKLLSRFVSENSHLIQKVNSIKKEQGQEGVKRLFHTMKGVCANLSLVELKKLCISAEEALGSEKSDMEGLIASIEKRIYKIETAIKPLLSLDVSYQKRTLEPFSADPELKKLFIQLDELLELNDIECEDVWKKIKSKIKGFIPQDELDEFENLIEDLEFEAARDRLALIDSKLQQ